MFSAAFVFSKLSQQVVFHVRAVQLVLHVPCTQLNSLKCWLPTIENTHNMGMKIVLFVNSLHTTSNKWSQTDSRVYTRYQKYWCWTKYCAAVTCSVLFQTRKNKTTQTTHVPLNALTLARSYCLTRCHRSTDVHKDWKRCHLLVFLSRFFWSTSVQLKCQPVSTARCLLFPTHRLDSSLRSVSIWNHCALRLGVSRSRVSLDHISSP